MLNSFVMDEKIAILGAGAWGTAMACALARNGYTVMLWSRREDVCAAINRKHINERYLPGYPIPQSVTASTDMALVCENAAALFLASPSLYLTGTVEQWLAAYAPGADKKGECPLIAVLTKGFIPDENGDPQLILNALEKIVPPAYREHIVYVAGPSHGEEVAAGKLTGLIAASHNPLCSIRCREILKSRSLLVYASLDVIGVQVCAAAKNVIAIAFGMLDAMTEHSDFFGDNTESLLLAAGLNEIQIIGRAMGATHPETFTSISGIGDLDVTCRSKYGRNRKFGREIITERVLEQFSGIDDLIARIEKIGYFPEGIVACSYLDKLARKYELKVPLCTGLYRILNKELAPIEFIENLLGNSKGNL